MDKALIIGCCSNYNWNDVRYWVNSIRQTGFSGDVVLVGSNISEDTLDRLKKEGVIAVKYKGDKTTPPHVERFLLVWDYLKENVEKYHTVIFTDVRDVVFQKNPDAALDGIYARYNKIKLIASCEGLKYKDEPWGSQNLAQTFGTLIYDQMKNYHIFNVGVIAGNCEVIKDLMLHLYVMSTNRPIQIVDQAVYNFLVHHQPYRYMTRYAYNTDAWAIQLGTTLGAVEAGSGDLGMMIKQDPSKKDNYIKAYADKQPVIKNDLVTNGKEAFAIVHQWDRIPAVKEIVEKKFGGGKEENDYIIIKTG